MDLGCLGAWRDPPIMWSKGGQKGVPPMTPYGPLLDPLLEPSQHPLRVVYRRVYHPIPLDYHRGTLWDHGAKGPDGLEGGGYGVSKGVVQRGPPKGLGSKKGCRDMRPEHDVLKLNDPLNHPIWPFLDPFWTPSGTSPNTPFGGIEGIGPFDLPFGYPFGGSPDGVK